MKLTREEVQHLAALARLRLSEEETTQLVGELSRILGYMEKLNELDTAAVEPLAHVVDVVNAFREDRVANPASPETVLANAPGRDQTFFQVPKIIE